MRRAGGRPTPVLRSFLAAAGTAAVALLLALPLAPAAASPLPAGGLPGPEVIDRSTLTPILVGSGCAATSVVLPVAGPVTWSVLGAEWTVVDASEPIGIDPASTTRFRAGLSQGARFAEGGTKAEWTVGPAGTDVVTGCTAAPSAPPPSSPAPPATSTTSPPAPTTTTASPRSAVPAPQPTGGTSAGSGSTGGEAPAPGTTSARAAAAGPGTPEGAGSSSVAGGGAGATTDDADDGATTGEPVLALAQPSVETRVLSNSFNRPEVSTTAAAVAAPPGSGSAGTTAPLAGVVALLAGSGLVAGLLLYRGARGTVRSGPRH